MSLILGIGCRAAAPFASLLATAQSALNGASPDAIAISANRAELDTVFQLSEALNTRLLILPLDALKGQDTPTQSARIRATFGTGSLAEALALRAGANTRLIAPRIISPDGTVTAAIAEGDLA